MLPIIAITMGDPAGIGPEVCLKMLHSGPIRRHCRTVVLGDRSAMDRAAAQCGLPPIQNVLQFDSDSEVRQQELIVRIAEQVEPVLVDFNSPGIADIAIGRVSRFAGDAAYQYITTAIRWHLNGWIDGITTGPINKTALQAAGHDFPGHTELFAERTDSPNYCMMQYSEELTCSFVTTHVGYDQVPGLLTTARIVDVIQLSHEAIARIRGRQPSIVVCGLNPHAGEGGLFGNHEEERIILPAIQAARSSGIDVSGPLPPDTCFIPARRKSTDCFICMYHDQGHIPLKAIAFDQAVNVTLGLPIVRTSVDHGTAFDIAGKNQADPSSLIAAIELAVRLANDRANLST